MSGEGNEEKTDRQTFRQADRDKMGLGELGSVVKKLRPQKPTAFIVHV